MSPSEPRHSMARTTLVLAPLLIAAAVSVCSGEGQSINILSCIYIYGGECPDSRVHFYMYTPSNPTIAKEILYDKEKSNLLQIKFNASLPTKILIHGYNSDKAIFNPTKREYLERGDYNVVLVDWSPLVRNPCYITAVHNTHFVGKCVAEVVQRMRQVGSTDVHLVGFSLGAHVPAFAADALRPWVLPRVTGLDPAMPLFITSHADKKLDPSDALFVDVVHSNAFAQGKAERCGHVDFYMNGGVTQPGCHGDSGCNHYRALAYFTESLRSTRGFWGWVCGGLLHYVLGLCPPRGAAQRMGEDADHSARGFYLVMTNAESPFARGPWSPSPAEFLRSRAHLGGRRSVPVTDQASENPARPVPSRTACVVGFCEDTVDSNALSAPKTKAF